jgi:hypothetical protein
MGNELVNLSALVDLLRSHNENLLNSIYALIDASAQAGRADRPENDDDYDVSDNGQPVTAARRKSKGVSGDEDEREAEGLTTERDVSARMAMLAEDRGALILGRTRTDPFGLSPPDSGPVSQRSTVIGGLTVPGEVADSERDMSALTAERKRAGGLVIPDDRNETTTRAELIALMSADVRAMLTDNKWPRRDSRKQVVGGLFLPDEEL